MSGPPGFPPFGGFRPGMPPGGMGFPGQPPAFGMRPPMMMQGGMGGMGGMGMGGGMPMPGMGMQGMRPPGMMGGMPGGLLLPRPPAMGVSALAKSVYVPPSIMEKSTTVYVGKIASTVADDVIRMLLDACGRVKSWKRQTDPDTKAPKGFGFCEFEDAEGVLRAMRLLNGLKLDGQELLLKGNAATQKYTEQYEQQKTAQKAEKKARAAVEKAEKAGKAAAAAAAASKDAGGDTAMGEAGEKAAAGEADGEEEDEDAAADNRVLEIIMSTVSERAETNRGSLPPPPPLPAGGLAGAAQAASDFLAALGSPVSGGGKSSASQPGKESDREKERDAKEREREMRDREREWAREADVERRKDDERRRELDAKYEAKLREWERYERRGVIAAAWRGLRAHGSRHGVRISTSTSSCQQAFLPQ